MDDIIHHYNPGDLIDEHWKAPLSGAVELWHTGRYIIHDKKDIYCESSEIGYTEYRALVLYFKQPPRFHSQEDVRTGGTITITHWNDQELLDKHSSTVWSVVLESGLSWEDKD